MTMPQMPRPGTSTAAIVALNAAKGTAVRELKEAEEKLEANRDAVIEWEQIVAEKRRDLRDLANALERLGATP